MVVCVCVREHLYVYMCGTSVHALSQTYWGDSSIVSLNLAESFHECRGSCDFERLFRAIWSYVHQVFIASGSVWVLNQVLLHVCGISPIHTGFVTIKYKVSQAWMFLHTNKDYTVWKRYFACVKLAMHMCTDIEVKVRKQMHLLGAWRRAAWLCVSEAVDILFNVEKHLSMWRVCMNHDSFCQDVRRNV